MKKRRIQIFAAILLVFAQIFALLPLSVVAETSFWTGNEWNVSEQEMAKVENLKLGREDARSSFFPFTDEKAALNSQQPGKDRDLTEANFQSLNTADGQIWKFYYVPYPAARTSRPDNDNIMNSDYDDSSWDEITVPKSWEASYNEDGTFKYNPPQYSNTDYAWITQNPNPTAPHAPTQFNPVGFYRTRINVDPSFKGRSVFLTFEGVESAFYLWVNGHKVGFSEDSFTSKEFKIDEYLNFDGNDTLAVEVFKWSSGSWFEDQDMLRLAGIFRSVYLTSKDNVEIRDFTINTTKTGTGTDPDEDYKDFNFELYANIRDLGANTSKKNGLTVSVKLYDKDGKLVSDEILENKELEKTINSSDFTAEDSMGRPTTTVKLSATVKNPLKWSAEQPNLYKALITLRDSENNIIETTAYRFGFRMIEIKNLNQPNAQMIINGQTLLIKGVNVHENNYETGRSMTYELIKKDVTMMKQYNFNAIRMSHYSHDFRYYDLADELGMYVCDEANIETHGNRSIPSNNSNYLPAVLDRLSSMFYRSKNFPCVIIYSLGNEAGSGSVFAEMNKWLKGNYTGSPDFYIDDTLKGDIQGRPIHYEGDNSNADIKSNMYPGVNEVISNSNVNKPYVLCEYSHAMGTSGGYYQEYWDAFESKENIQGGWIWDWVDQSMLTYVEPDAFPPQTSLGWQSGKIVSEDVYKTELIPTGGPESLSSKGASGASGDYALKGAAYAQVTNEALNLNSSFSIDVWVKPENTSTSPRTIVAKGDNQYKLQTVNGTVQFNTYYNGWNELVYKYDASTWANEWHHIVVVYDAPTKTGTLYVDDVNEPKQVTVFSKAAENGDFSKSSQNFGVGRDTQNAGGRDWQGLIDSVRVFNTALTPEEVAGTHSSSDENVVYWDDFDNGMTTENVDNSNYVYSIKSQDSLNTVTSLVNRSEAITKAGVSGEPDDKALEGPAVAKNTPNELNISGEFTLEAWVYPTVDTRPRVIMCKGDTQYVLRTQNGQLCLQLYSDVGGNWNQLLYTYDNTWNGNWHHVAATYDPATKTAKMYIDDMSAPVAETQFSNVHDDGTFSSNGEEFSIGRETTNTSRDWMGLIDNVRVYNRALSSEELQSEARTSKDSGVVFWQDFNTEATVSLPSVEEGYFGFGGDWGDAPNSSNFCANGIVSTDRIPHGAMLEIKRVHQDYVMNLNGSTTTSANVSIRSRALFTNANEYDFVWELKENGKTIRSGNMDLDIAPLETKDIEITFDEVTPQNGNEYYLTMKFLLKEDTEWAEVGHEISAAQAEIDFKTAELPSDTLDDVADLSYEETDNTYNVTGKDFTLTFDREKGTIKSFVYKGTEIFAQDGLNGPEPNFWRAPTDGDRLSNIATTWRYAGAERTEITTELEPVNSKALKINVSGKLAPSSGSASYTMSFIIYGDGQILVDNTFTSSGFSDRDLIPVIGNEMQLSPQFENLTWFGRGSDQDGLASESYPDRYANQFVDLYEDQVENQFIPYIRNQTFGNKSDVRWAALTDNDGKGIIISAVGEPLNINAQHYTQEELTSFGSKHPYESQKTENIVLNLDYKNMAVGYDPGWLSKNWFEESDMIRPNKTYIYQYKLSPVEEFTPEEAFEAYNQSYGDGYKCVTIEAANSSEPVYVSVNGGTPEALPTIVKAREGDQVTLTSSVRNDIDYSFTGWYDKNGNVISDAESLVYTVNASETINVEYKWTGAVSIATGAEVTASQVNNDWKASNLTDGILNYEGGNRGWSSSGQGKSTVLNTPVTAIINLGRVKSFDSFKLYPRTDLSLNGNSVNFPINYSISISTDGEEYETVYSTENGDAPYKKPVEIKLSELKNAQYIKLEVNAVNQADEDGNVYVQLSEFGVYNSHAAAISGPDEVIKNEKFELTVNSPYPLGKVTVYNENDRKVSSSIVSMSENEDGSCTAVLRLSVGTVGENRNLRIYSGENLLGDYTFDVINIPTGILSVEAPETVLVWEDFETTVVTTKDLVKVKFFNEKGNVVGKTQTARVIKDGIATNIFEMNIGTPGMRTLTVKADYDKQNNFPFETSFDINVTTLAE